MAEQIVLGKGTSGDVTIDLDALLRTRLLIQGNSGSGKSWLLRRLGEQLFGHLPVIIIDPEGEFATLRERFGYVLVGKGGETPADTRSAELVARKLLELRASAVCDLYEVKAAQRHVWVRLFLESLIDAPKKLWHPTIVIVDEAHLFSPERGQGDSEALEAMTDLATRGRKRGFCPIFATQRLGKLSKNVAAELLNVLVGSTFIDVDRERAADALGIPRSGRAEFFDDIRLLDHGYFYALGRAITTERKLVHVGSVKTTHPEPGSAKQSAEPPPAPEKVRELLPKLADLPRQAEEKARTEAELRAEIRSLKADLAARPTIAKAVERIVDRPVLKTSQLVGFEKSIGRIEMILKRIDEYHGIIETRGQILREAAAEISALVRPAAPIHAAVAQGPEQLPRKEQGGGSNPPRRAASSLLTGPEARLMVALAQHGPRLVKVLAILSRYKATGGAFRNPLGSLRSKGYVVDAAGVVGATRVGLDALGDWEPLPSGRGLLQWWLQTLPGPAAKLLRAVSTSSPISVEDLAKATNYEMGGGAFRNPLGRLRALGLIAGRAEIMLAKELMD